MIDEIITDILKAEGWDTYTNDPADRGGPTKWGITQKAWAEWRGRDVTPEEVQQITEPQARDFYEAVYIVSPRFNQLPERIRAMVIDCGVNHGVTRASKWVQRAVGAKEDGLIGPKTLAAVAQENPIAIYARISSYRIQLYGRIVSKDEELKAAQEAGFELQAKFAGGWNNRAAKWLDRLADSLTGG